MEKYKITMGDFLKNAGIVGLKYLLDTAEAEENQDFGISENGQELWLSSEFAERADWTDLYFLQTKINSILDPLIGRKRSEILDKRPKI